MKPVAAAEVFVGVISAQAESRHNDSLCYISTVYALELFMSAHDLLFGLNSLFYDGNMLESN